MITQLLFTLFCTVFFCLGAYLVTQDGYLLDFIRTFFDKCMNKAELYDQQKNWKAWIYKSICILSLPLIMCITCMGSFWGFSVFVLLNGFHADLIVYMIINCFAASFIQTFIWNLYVKTNL